ncbi:MAG: type II secretion system F family protein [Armatimonadota bacterium]
MPLFKYEVMDKSGRHLPGVMSAPSEAEVMRRLTGSGYSILSVSCTSRRTSRDGAPLSELAVFFRGLASYLHAGMSAHQALVQFSDGTRVRGMRRIAESLAERVQFGGRLAEAMEEFPRAFPPHIIGVVRAGELGGFLPVVAADLALDYELAGRGSRRWVQWVSRLGWINAVGTVLLAPALPLLFTPGVDSVAKWAQKYTDWTLPHIALPMAALFGLYYGGRAVLASPGMRGTAHALLLRMPWAGRASRERSLATFSRILWRLQNAGILPISAWEAASCAAENQVVASRLRAQVGAVRAGRKLSEALSATGLFSADDLRGVAAGEATGQLPDSLQRLSAYYEDAAATSAQRAGWLGLRAMILANVIAVGALLICMQGLSLSRMFDWVDWFMGAN